MKKSQAIEYFGSVSALAQSLGVTYEAVRQWDEVPELRQYQLEHLTGGMLTADHLPNLNPNLRKNSPTDQSTVNAGILYSGMEATE
ncbi:Cro/CI family transcriptional regulator [Xanthomonas sp. WHRI 1810A]|uniref:Cro/CI family transcriptional regulator n=1 Tax=Xanthomonas sp. WHRI 1810A TaxID=3161565 RepID=UPI0032E8945F